jgi:hypothetical protein
VTEEILKAADEHQESNFSLHTMRFRRPIGLGGQGGVWLAEDSHSGLRYAVKQVRKASEKRPKTEKRPRVRTAASPRRKTNVRAIPEGYEPLASNSSRTSGSYFAANRSASSRSSSTRRRNARGRFFSPAPARRTTVKRVPSPVAAANANVYSSNFESLSSNSAKSVKSNAGLGPAKLGSSNFASSSSNAVPNLD